VRTIVLKGLKRLAAAIAAGDGEAAAEAMRAHLENAKQILIDKIRGT
jgi:DNA-binding FadR family transcriptional regulator